MASDAAEVAVALLPFLRVYKNGRVERLLGTDIVAASFDVSTGVTSKDVTIDPTTNLSVRLYLPTIATGEKLPILVYIHGGGFMVESAASPTYHGYLNTLTSRAGVLALSVDYRRAPEHALPAAYDDSWAALVWAVSNSLSGGSEPWLAAHGDVSRVFLAGDSAGANIAHNVAMRAATEGLPPDAAIRGLLLFHPLFWDASNSAAPELEVKISSAWQFVCPSSEAGLDDPRLNPMAEAAPGLATLPCKRVMVTVAERDFLAVRGRKYFEALQASGWGGEAELVNTAGEGHVFHLLSSTSEKAAEKMDRVASFLARH